MCQLRIYMYTCKCVYEIRYTCISFALFVLIFVHESSLRADNIRDELDEVYMYVYICIYVDEFYLDVSITYIYLYM
jgi:hypothetical protein